MTSKFLLFLLAFSFYYQNGQSAKILAVFPMPSYSHWSLTFRIAKELADRGHEVTAINPYPQKTPIKNYKDISVEELHKYMDEVKKNLFNISSFNPLQSLNFIFDIGNQMTETTFQNEQVQKLLKSGEKFDLLIMEHFLTDALVGLAHHFNVPSIFLTSTAAIGGLSAHTVANPTPSAYVPNAHGDFTKHMNFCQRTQNFLMSIFGDLARELIFLPKQRKIFKEYIKTDLELDDLVYNVSLILSNSHVSVNDAVPYVPSVIEIGGFHIKPPQKLSADLQKFLDDAKEGVILFSMGSNLKSKDLEPEVRDVLLRSFSKIKQKVLWKFEDDLSDVPKNVKIMKWVPQQDVLAHPNVQVFISHGGLLSSIETVYFGKPIVGIPVMADQESNVARAVANGYAVSVPLSEISEEKLSEALNEVLNNPKYRENVQQRSRVMHDQPMKPLDSAIYWIEHVIRHKGAPHLRSAGLDLRWYQREMIDVIGFLSLVLVISPMVIFLGIRKILGMCFRKKGKITKNKKNK